MIANIFFAAFLVLGVAQENNNELYSDVDILKKLTDEGKVVVVSTLAELNNTPQQFNDYIRERVESLLWAGQKSMDNINSIVNDAVLKGMGKNQKVANYQCVSKSAEDIKSKLNAIFTEIPNNTEKIKERELTVLMPLKRVLKGFENYVEALFKIKSEELKKATSNEARKKIIDEVRKKMELLNSILEQIRSQQKAGLFKFFENYVQYAFETEKSFETTLRKGAETIMKCVS